MSRRQYAAQRSEWGGGITARKTLMKRSLRKTDAHVSVQYTNGNYSNNLRGTEFELEGKEDCICLSINLESNLRVRNKSVNSYHDVNELARDHALLKWVQIDDEQVIDGLSAASNRSPTARWELTLRLGEKGTFTYPVKPRTVNHSLFLDVQ